jgi:hypothetical protein
MTVSIWLSLFLTLLEMQVTVHAPLYRLKQNSTFKHENGDILNLKHLQMCLIDDYHRTNVTNMCLSMVSSIWSSSKMKRESLTRKDRTRLNKMEF